MKEILAFFQGFGRWCEKTNRIRSLRGSPGERLKPGHIDSLEILQNHRDRKLKVIYDIGANRGTWTLLAKSIFPDAEIIAFEPLAGHVEEFKKNTGNLKKIRIFETCLGSKPGKALIQITNYSDAASLLSPSRKGKKEWSLQVEKRKKVNLTTLDLLIQSGKIPPPDLIKMDVQGYEIEVLKGSSGILAKKEPLLLLEVSFEKFYLKQPLFSDLVHYLSKKGFEIKTFGKGLSPGIKAKQVDVLFEKVKK
jgi:FkbM family methyltransferase